MSLESAISKDKSKEFENKGIWIFVGIDLLIFSLFFLIFIIEKSNDYETFELSRLTLNPTIGFVNTLFLLTSSWLLLLSISKLPQEQRKAKKYLVGSILFGIFFLLLKFFEYYQKISLGITPVDNIFYTFYFLLTFIHFCHVIAGLIALKVVLSWFAGDLSTSKASFMESVGIYWHMVDLLWIFLFLLLYLLG